MKLAQKIVKIFQNIKKKTLQVSQTLLLPGTTFGFDTPVKKDLTWGHNFFGSVFLRF